MVRYPTLDKCNFLSNAEFLSLWLTEVWRFNSIGAFTTQKQGEIKGSPGIELKLAWRARFWRSSRPKEALYDGSHKLRAAIKKSACYRLLYERAIVIGCDRWYAWIRGTESYVRIIYRFLRAWFVREKPQNVAQIWLCFWELQWEKRSCNGNAREAARRGFFLCNLISDWAATKSSAWILNMTVL